MPQTDDDHEFLQYGGLLFATGSIDIRLWAPDKKNTYDNGRIIMSGDGWGSSSSSVSSNEAFVRVFAFGQSCKGHLFFSFLFFSFLFQHFLLVLVLVLVIFF